MGMPEAGVTWQSGRLSVGHKEGRPCMSDKLPQSERRRTRGSRMSDVLRHGARKINRHRLCRLRITLLLGLPSLAVICLLP